MKHIEKCCAQNVGLRFTRAFAVKMHMTHPGGVEPRLVGILYEIRWDNHEKAFLQQYDFIAFAKGNCVFHRFPKPWDFK